MLEPYSSTTLFSWSSCGFICNVLTRCDVRCFSFKSSGLGCKSFAVSTIRAVCLAFNQSASVADGPPSRDGFSVDLFVAGDVGAFFLLAPGVFVPSIMVSTAVPAGSLFELQSDGILAAPTSKKAAPRVNPPRPPHMAHQFPPQPPGQFYNYHGGGTTHTQTGPRPPPPAPPVQLQARAPLGQGDATQFTQPRYSQLLPSTFQSDDIFLDKTEVRGLQLYRHIQPTQWSRRVGLAGTAILDLLLTRLLRGGAEDHALRALSHGRYSTPVMAQTIAEAVLLTSILKALRGREVDIDRMACSLHADNAPDKRNEAMQFMEPSCAQNRGSHRVAAARQAGEPHSPQNCRIGATA